MQHPFSKSISIKSRLSEHIFKKCGKQEEYGFDTVTYNSAADVIRFHRGNQVNMGMKLLSSSLSSLYSFEWYDGYSVDTSLWNWMNHGALQPQYTSTTVDGPVTITAQMPVVLAPGGSFNPDYAVEIFSTFTTGNPNA